MRLSFARCTVQRRYAHKKASTRDHGAASQGRVGAREVAATNRADMTSKPTQHTSSQNKQYWRACTCADKGSGGWVTKAGAREFARRCATQRARKPPIRNGAQLKFAQSLE